MKLPSKSTKNMKKTILISALFVIVALGLGYTLFTYFNDNTEQSANQMINMKKSDAENEREKELKSDPSKKTQNQSDSPTPPAVDPSTGKQMVNVLITDAGIYDSNVEVRGFVSNTVEEQGSCVYVFTNSKTSIQKTTRPLSNPTSTSCETVKFDVTELQTGIWSVTLKFVSDTSYGISSPKEFIVP